MVQSAIRNSRCSDRSKFKNTLNENTIKSSPFIIFYNVDYIDGKGKEQIYQTRLRMKFIFEFTCVFQNIIDSPLRNRGAKDDTNHYLRHCLLFQNHSHENMDCGFEMKNREMWYSVEVQRTNLSS